MESFEVFSYLIAVFIGLTLGILGGGGSMLTLPVFVYFLGISPIIATGYSLFSVGISALTGFVSYAGNRWINLKAAIWFGVPSICSVFVMRKWVIQGIPETLFQSPVIITRDFFLMTFFSLVMLAAGIAMLKNRGKENAELNFPITWKLMVAGMLEGMVTGLVGAGGGFLIVPALVLLCCIEMKTAIGTSLLIIAIKSLIGFTGDLSAGLQPDWQFLLAFTGFSVLGILAGFRIVKKVNPDGLKKGFGIFVLLVAALILIKEIVGLV